MRCMREGLPAMAQARQNHVLILPGGIADVTARGMRSGEGSCRATLSNHNGKLHARGARRARLLYTPERATASQSEAHAPFILSL
jgi:hypothetical protein